VGISLLRKARQGSAVLVTQTLHKPHKWLQQHWADVLQLDNHCSQPETLHIAHCSMEGEAWQNLTALPLTSSAAPPGMKY